MSNPFNDRACKDSPTGVFFEDSWAKRKVPFTIALDIARGLCDTCPVRGECLVMEMEAEQGAAESHRAGVFGGMTAAQRYSLEKRGVDWNGADPVLLRAGILPNGATMLPIPDRGDQWTERHTRMAETVIAWLVENVEPDGEVPTSAQLSRKLSLRVNDMRRVYDALAADQLIEVMPDTGVIVRRASASATKGWVPPHLRIDS